MKRLWLCSTIAVLVALVASWSVKPVGGMFTAVALYGVYPCLQPPTSLTFSRELTCTPISSDDVRACAFNGITYSVTNCSEYFAEWNIHQLMSQAFGDYPYLVVEEHDPSARYCGDFERVINFTSHLLDERCHVNQDGTASSRISLGRSLTIAKYRDSTCSNLLEVTDVPYAEDYDRGCVNKSTRYRYVGPRPPMSAVAVYEDSSCSRPVQLTLTQGFVCKVASPQSCVRDDKAHYSISSCSSDYRDFASAAFGNATPFIMEEHFTNYWCGSSSVDAVMVYALDNICHSNADNTTSFRAALDSEGSVTITTYEDANCELVGSSVDITKRTHMCLPRDCGSDFAYGCAKRYSVGGLWGYPLSDGQMSAVAVYEKGECAQPATTLTLTREFTCGFQVTNSNTSNAAWRNSESQPVCRSSGVGSSLTGCSFYNFDWDISSMISQAFGNSDEHHYLMVEQYDSNASYCGNVLLIGVINATLHLLDETCHVNLDGTSSKITLGRRLTIVEYSDSQCTNVVAEADVPYGDAGDRACVNNTTRYRYMGPTPPMSAVAVYEDSSCSTPVKLTLMQGFVCEAERAPDTMTCTPDGNSHYSVSNCSSDYRELAAAVFSGGEPYVMVEEFLSAAWCGYADVVTVYAMDNKCHSNTDDTTSFRATRSADGSAIITTFADANCETIESSTDFTKRSQMCLPQHDCGSDLIHGCARRFSVGGDFGAPLATRAMTAVAVYDGGSCKAPTSTLTFSRELTCSPLVRVRVASSSPSSSDSNYDESNDDVVCEYNGIVNTITDCAEYGSLWSGSDMLTRAFGRHGEHPYLLVEQYDPRARYRWEEDEMLNATAYILDESCHVSRDGTTSSKFTLGRGLTIMEYSDPQCAFITSEVDVPFAYSYYWSTNNATRYRYVGSPPPPMSAVAVYEDSSCSANPVKLTMTQGFVCEAERHPEKTVCGPDGSSHYSVSSCSSDYKAFASVTFWNGAPYVIVEEFKGDYWQNIFSDYCQQADVDAVTVYIMDDTCHADTNDATSFRATLTSDGEASITTYTDTNCERVQSSIDFTKRSQMCLPDRNCDGGYSCAKRYSVGNLVNTTARAQESVLVVYEDTTCTTAPALLTLTELATCSSSVTEACREVVDAQDALSYSRECVDDTVAFVTSKFDGIPHLIMETYADGTNCQSRKEATVYNADGRCHPGVDQQAYFQVSLGMDNSVTLATFPDAYCRASEADYVTVGNKYLDTDACFDGNTRIYTHLTASSTPPAEFQTREDIMFPAWLWEPTARRIFESD